MVGYGNVAASDGGPDVRCWVGSLADMALISLELAWW